MTGVWGRRGGALRRGGGEGGAGEGRKGAAPANNVAGRRTPSASGAGTRAQAWGKDSGGPRAWCRAGRSGAGLGRRACFTAGPAVTAATCSPCAFYTHWPRREPSSPPLWEETRGEVGANPAGGTEPRRWAPSQRWTSGRTGSG